MTLDPHGPQPILRLGPQPADARLVVVCIHGRGASAEDILGLAQELATPDVAYVAPQAADNTWYPYSFLEPLERNQPGLTSGLNKIAAIIGSLDANGIPRERVGLMGFSQGACLSLEFAARNPGRYAAIVGLSGGLIGPPGTHRTYAGSMEGTPVFLGCSDVDPHIPLERVHETTGVFRVLRAKVDERIYPRMGHLVNADEIAAARTLLADGQTAT
jgi:predicted esterase